MEHSEIENLDINDIDGGRLAAHIKEHIKDLAADIADPNKPSKTRRELVVTIGFSPSKSRREAEIDYIVKPKLAAMEKQKTHCYIRRVNGEAVAVNAHIEQQDLAFDAETDSAN